MLNKSIETIVEDYESNSESMEEKSGDDSVNSYYEEISDSFAQSQFPDTSIKRASYGKIVVADDQYINLEILKNNFIDLKINKDDCIFCING